MPSDSTGGQAQWTGGHLLPRELPPPSAATGAAVGVVPATKRHRSRRHRTSSSANDAEVTVRSRALSPPIQKHRPVAEHLVVDAIAALNARQAHLESHLERLTGSVQPVSREQLRSEGRGDTKREERYREVSRDSATSKLRSSRRNHRTHSRAGWGATMKSGRHTSPPVGGPGLKRRTQVQRPASPSCGAQGGRRAESYGQLGRCDAFSP